MKLHGYDDGSNGVDVGNDDDDDYDSDGSKLVL
jgi:hypothetical protein